MIPYNSFRFIFPTRPETALPSSMLPSYEGGYLAQPKLNGDCMEVYTNGKEIIIMDRHKKVYKKVIPALLASLRSLYRETLADGLVTNKWMVLVGEHMIKSQLGENGRVFNNKFVIHDILVYDGMQLLGTTFEDRRILLDKIYGQDDTELNDNGVTQYEHIYTTPAKDVYRVKTYYDCFPTLWTNLIKTGMYEGLVLKKINAPLQHGLTEKNNSGGLVKFRKPTKNYTH